MNAPNEQDRKIELRQLIERDLRLEHIFVDLRPGIATISIGGPGFEHRINKERLMSGDLRAYAKEIVDEWEAQRGTT